ncbi:uncharacterized protein B0P05DRAFT_477650 [Gilbertella persicaria]|uniref:uncharacterized protein n=1 Tax=Gilbertella persicaria TaxID=101096 RepID=UPI002220B8FD|nr:uncharacterized protein B0P05DRAFT_477650 [Gilbertella persicaria]KAI8061485.1 hypothetical protein B0P05DRAFT_477650 [Gilbertella persicaria]
MRVQLEQGLTFSIRSARTYKGYIVYVPKSEFLLIAGNSTRDTDNDIKEAILRTFKADSIMFQYVRDKAVEHFRNFTRVRQEGGVFAQLRKNQVDANPLDIRQSSKTKDWDDKFVEEGEQTRRIKPIEDKKLVARFDVLKNEFGWNSQTQSDLANVKFELNLRGKHVPMGIKFMVEKGLVEMPAPEWLTSVPSTNATYFHVTKDGASQTKPNQNAEDEEMEEQEETQDVESQAASDSE